MSRRPLWRPRTLAVCICGGILAGTLNWMMPGYTGIILFCGVIVTISVGRLVATGDGLGRSMDWHLHRQAIGRAGPGLMIISILWLIAGYFYFDPLVRLGLAPAPKASWGETAHWLYIETALTCGISASVGLLIGYVMHYARLRRGERFDPISWRTYALAVCAFAFSLIISLATLHYLLPFWIPGFDLFAELAAS